MDNWDIIKMISFRAFWDGWPEIFSLGITSKQESVIQEYGQDIIKRKNASGIDRSTFYT